MMSDGFEETGSRGLWGRQSSDSRTCMPLEEMSRAGTPYASSNEPDLIY